MSQAFPITDLAGTTKLNNGVEIPYFGLGVYQMDDPAVPTRLALDAGYRLVDTAMIYGNEEGVGQAVRESSVPREDIFVTSKVWNADQGHESTLAAFDRTLETLGLDYLDLYLIHWPVRGKYVETWRAMETIYASGRVRAIGVSNFKQHHLEDVLASGDVVPAVNQMEFHPRLVQQELLDFCADKGIQYQSWSPLMQGGIFELDAMAALATKYDRSAAQIVLRWNLQKGVITIPKSVRQERIIENAALFDFELSAEDVAAIDALDTGHRLGPDPDTFDF